RTARIAARLRGACLCGPRDRVAAAALAARVIFSIVVLDRGAHTMLEPEIAAFVAAVDAWYPADAAARSHDEQRRLYDRFAAEWTPAALPAGIVRQDAVWHARRTAARSRCGAIRPRTARHAARCCFFMAAVSSSARSTVMR
ncbi:hypothetical protein M3643_12510, partial [Staphylococcus lugdunensis]|nr:hypothetical protein [Staphylococcus lugdunensis]